MVSALGSDILDKMPLFPVAVIGGFIVQWMVGRTGQAHRVDKRAVEGISSVALDVLLVCAIGTMSLATIGSNVPAMIVFTVVGVGWSVVCLLTVGRRFHRDDWFEHSIADFGQSQGNVATGFVLADMVDPQRRTATADAYGYKQLPYEPFLGGGLLTHSPCRSSSRSDCRGSRWSACWQPWPSGSGECSVGNPDNDY